MNYFQISQIYLIYWPKFWDFVQKWLLAPEKLAHFRISRTNNRINNFFVNSFTFCATIGHSFFTYFDRRRV